MITDKWYLIKDNWMCLFKVMNFWILNISDLSLYNMMLLQTIHISKNWKKDLGLCKGRLSSTSLKHDAEFPILLQR